MNGGQQIVGGLLAYCFTLIHKGPLKSWQAIFIGYGCFSVSSPINTRPALHCKI